MSATTDTSEHQKRVYRYWAPIYDGIYRYLLADSQRQLVALAAEAGRDILEVGVGTGLVLRHYPRHCRVTGIDLSEDMIARARQKVESEQLSHVVALKVMNAHRLEFADGSFDAVTLPFVVTLIPDPERALDECARVLKPGGRIVIASKLVSGRGLQGRIERAAAPLVHRIGWSSDFRISRITDWAEKHGGLRFEGIRPAFPAGFFKVLSLRREEGADPRP